MKKIQKPIPEFTAEEFAEKIANDGEIIDGHEVQECLEHTNVGKHYIDGRCIYFTY